MSSFFFFVDLIFFPEFHISGWFLHGKFILLAKIRFGILFAFFFIYLSLFLNQAWRYQIDHSGRGGIGINCSIVLHQIFFFKTINLRSNYFQQQKKNLRGMVNISKYFNLLKFCHIFLTLRRGESDKCPIWRSPDTK